MARVQVSRRMVASKGTPTLGRAQLKQVNTRTQRESAGPRSRLHLVGGPTSGRARRRRRRRHQISSIGFLFALAIYLAGSKLTKSEEIMLEDANEPLATRCVRPESDWARRGRANGRKSRALVGSQRQTRRGWRVFALVSLASAFVCVCLFWLRPSARPPEFHANECFHRLLSDVIVVAAHAHWRDSCNR